MKEKLIGVARKAGAVLRGQTGILSTLIGEHGELSELMDQISRTEGDVTRRRELWADFRKKLLLHTQAETDTFYAPLQTDRHMEKLVIDSRAEHERFERQINTLDDMPLDAPLWIESFRELRYGVARHIRKEEERLFVRSKEYISKPRLRRLDDDYKARRQQLERAYVAPAEHETIRPPTSPYL